jgi:hypothetical protein
MTFRQRHLSAQRSSQEKAEGGIYIEREKQVPSASLRAGSLLRSGRQSECDDSPWKL